MAATRPKPKAAAKVKTSASSSAKTNKEPVVRPKDLHVTLPSSRALVGQAWQIFKENWRVLSGIVLVYLLLNLIFAGGLNGLGQVVNNIRNNQGSTGLGKALSSFGLLVGSSGSTGSAATSLLQTLLFVIESLVIIWALRQMVAGNKVGVKESYYHSTFPLIPLIAVMAVIFIQLLPLSLGAVFVNAVTSTVGGSLIWLNWLAWFVFVALGAWTIYLISSSIFAIYIVTLPEVQPREALRSAKQLVKFRRRLIIPKLIFLPVFTLLVMAIIILPLIIWLPALVAPVYYLLGMLVILFIHSYLYSLYRSLLG